jgi:pimeloyl-ACP methyl ester carboxylesterase
MFHQAGKCSWFTQAEAVLAKVKQRQMLYISGFDPRGASTYHKMMREAFEQHCRSNGLDGEFTARRRAPLDIHEWDAKILDDNGDIVCKFSFLDWGQMVRQYWTRPEFKAVLLGAVAAIRLIGRGMPQLMYRVSFPILITNMAPLISTVAWAIVLLTALISVFLAVVVSVFWGCLLLGISLIAAIWFWQVMKRFNVAWAGRINGFVSHAAKYPVLEEWQRPEEMADALLSALGNKENDEVLFVSHSIGTNVALLAIEQAIIKGSELINKAINDGRLVFVTLGQTIPAMAPTTLAVTHALKTLSDSQIPWLDISAPADPACFALTDPCVVVLGSKPRVHLKNAHFHKNFSAQTYNAAKENRFVLHFLYLRAPDAYEKPSFDFYDFVSSTELLSSKLDKTVMPVTPFFARQKSKARP